MDKIIVVNVEDTANSTTALRGANNSYATTELSGERTVWHYNLCNSAGDYVYWGGPDSNQEGAFATDTSRKDELELVYECFLNKTKADGSPDYDTSCNVP